MQADGTIAISIQRRWSRAYSSIIPARISGKSLCWMRSGSPCRRHTGIISHSTAIICGHARCLRTRDLMRMVKETGAKSTDLKSPETVEHLCGKCHESCRKLEGTAERRYGKNPHHKMNYENYKQSHRGQQVTFLVS